MITKEVNKQEGNSNPNDDGNKSKGSSSTTTNSTSSWTRLKDPRIVRVSRAFGGKDRHSKVCTVRGLRDRRVRLSVPTAIQLYDLQDRLGLNQPSKVVDWLLDAAKHEIDELPPLQIPPANLNPNIYPMLRIGGNSHQISNQEGLNKSINWDNVPLEPPNNNNNNNALGYNSNFLKWDPSNLSLAHSENSLSHQHDHHQDIHNFNLMSSMPLGSHHHQVVVYPPGLPQFFHQHNIVGASSSSEFDPKEINFQMLNNSGSENPMSSSTNSFRHSIDSTSQSIRPFHFLPSQNCDERESSN